MRGLKFLYPLDPLLRHHVLIGLLLAVWTFVFLYFTEPLDVSELNNTEKLYFLPGYGLLGGLSYIIFLPLQHYLYRKTNQNWTILNELIFILVFAVVAISVARLYYLNVIMIGERNPYTLGYMLKTIFLPALITILPILIIARFAFGKYHEKRLEDQKIELKGEGNFEGLRLQFNDLVCIQSSDNYIEVYYISGNDLKKTLIRNKLSVIAEEFPDLLRVHRSYIINPYHFQQWKTENGKRSMILSHDILVPISKTYQPAIKVAFQSTTI